MLCFDLFSLLMIHNFICMNSYVLLSCPFTALDWKINLCILYVLWWWYLVKLTVFIFKLLLHRKNYKMQMKKHALANTDHLSNNIRKGQARCLFAWFKVIWWETWREKMLAGSALWLLRKMLKLATFCKFSCLPARNTGRLIMFFLCKTSDDLKTLHK